MSLLAIAATVASGHTESYPYPEGVPYNVTFPLDIPTPPDGQGQVVHPSVKDMGETGWNGHRFWMVITPYPYQDVSKENPCILCSHDGIAWVEPEGISNPIYPWQGGTTWNNDPDIEFDPDTGRMWCWWRESPYSGALTAVWASWSTNGATWSTPLKAVQPADLPAGGLAVSPSVVRRAAGDWWMFTSGTPRSILRATSPGGPWVFQTGYSPPLPSGETLDHLEVIHDDGMFRMLAHTRTPWGLRATSSEDGVTWSPMSERLVVPQAGKARFDAEIIYRASFTPAGDDYNVWYGGISENVWKVGHTRIPRSHWGL